MAAILSLCLTGASAFAPVASRSFVAARATPASSVQMAADDLELLSRRSALGFGAAAVLGALPAFADDEVAAPPPPPPPPPPAKPKAVLLPEAAYKIKKDYPTDARTMLKNMVVATEMTRGTPDMEKIVVATRSEMNDFVAFYRRQPKVAGMPSFSTMYTAINTLSGHYASYGNKYPVPEKRKVRSAPPELEGDVMHLHAPFRCPAAPSQPLCLIPRIHFFPLALCRCACCSSTRRLSVRLPGASRRPADSTLGAASVPLDPAAMQPPARFTRSRQQAALGPPLTGGGGSLSLNRHVLEGDHAQARARRLC